MAMNTNSYYPHKGHDPGCYSCECSTCKATKGIKVDYFTFPMEKNQTIEDAKNEIPKNCRITVERITLFNPYDKNVDGSDKE